MERTVEVQAKGLWTHPNKLRLPPGALRLAENCVIDREGIISRRRGFDRYGDALSGPASAIFEYQRRIVILDAQTLKYDSDGSGTWVSYTGSHSPPSGVRMPFLESNQNLYFGTSLGPYIIDSLTGSPVRSGIPQGLDMQLSTTGTGGSWLIVNTTVGYVVTWKRTDANKNEKQGAPSFQKRISNSATAATWTRAVTTATVAHVGHGFTTGDSVEISASSDVTAITNGSKTVTVTGPDEYTFTCLGAGAASGTLSDGKAFDVSLTWTVPDDVVAVDRWELWRTDQAPAAGDPVGEDYRLILSGELSAAQKAAGVVTVTDDNDDTFLGEPLYTNAGEQSGKQENSRPPLCSFIAQFQNHTFYGMAAQPHLLDLQLVEVAGLVDDTSTITFTSGSTTLTYTFSAAENQGARKFQRFTTFLTLSQNLEATAESLVKIINRDTGNQLIVAHYASAESDPPGKLLFEKKTLGSSSFSVTCNNATTSTKFSPVIPTSGTTLSSDDLSRANRIYRSKRGQPEAVPRLNFVELGRRNKDLNGMVALQEALLIWKEDGIFSISGDGGDDAGSGFVDDEIDPTAELVARSTLALLNNTAIGFTSQGVLQAGTGAPAIVSRPMVETDLLRIAQFPTFTSLAFAIGYESDRKLLIFVPETRADNTCTIAYVWNYSTNSWTTWRKRVAAAHYFREEKLLYLAHAVDPYILRELKALETTGNDFIDEQIPVTITAVSTTTHPTTGKTVSLITLTYTYDEALAAGFLLTKDSKRTKIDVVESLGSQSFRVTCRNRLSFTTGAAMIGLSIPMLVEWAPVTKGDGASLKQFPFATIIPETGGGTFRLGFQTDIVQLMDFTRTMIGTKAKGWGSPGWGTFPWGDSSPGRVDAIRTMVPTNQQVGRALTVRLENVYAKEQVEILQLSLDLRAIGTRSQRSP